MAERESIAPRVLVGLALVVASAAVGVVFAWQPLLLGLPLLVLGVVTLLLGPFFMRLPRHVQLLLIAVFLNYENLLRYTLLDEWMAGVFQVVRIPLVVGAGLLLLVLRGGALASGVGRASSLIVFLYLAWATVSGVMSPDPSNSLFHVVALIFLVFILALTLSASPDPGVFWRGWLVSLVIGLCVLQVASLAMIALGLDFVRADRSVFGDVAVGYRGLLTGPNDFAQVACLALGATLALAELKGPGPRPWWFLPMVVICSIAGLLSGARSGLLGVFSGLAYLLVTSLLRSERVSRGRRTSLVVGLVGLAVVLVGLWSSQAGRTQLGRMVETADTLRGDAVEARPVVWVSYLQSVGRRPLFGIGYGNKATMDDRHTVRLVGLHASHSALLEYTIPTGLPGTLLFILVIVGAWRGSRHPKAGLFGSSVVHYWAAAWPVFLLSTGATGLAQVCGWSFWVPILCGLGFRGLQTGNEAEAETPEGPPARPARGLDPPPTVL